MTPKDKRKIKLLALVRVAKSGPYLVHVGISKPFGQDSGDYASLSSVMYGPGRRVAEVRHVRKHWTVKMVGAANIVASTFKTRQEALFHIANELGL